MDIQEIIKCNNVAYFGEKCANIKLYDKSKKVLEIYKNNKRIILQGIRQCGKTLLNKIYALHYAIFNPNSDVVIFYQNNIIFRYGKQNFHEYMDNLKFLDITITNSSDKKISFSNGSTISFASYDDNPDIFRGRTINLLIMEEFAYIKNNNIIDILFPLLNASNSKMIITSTKNVLNRKNNIFWKLWCNAVDKNEDSTFIPIYISAKDIPTMTDDIVSVQIKNMGKIRYDKEFEVSYIHSDPFTHSLDGEKLYTPTEMSKLFNVSTSTIARWRTQHRIKGVEVSQRKFYYTQQDIDKLLVPEINIKINKPAEHIKMNLVFSKLEESELDRKVFNIELGNLPVDIAEKYIKELVEKMKKHFPPSDG